ncbi:thiosulfate sulfurtransferase 16, chloroplastic isoform X2 [Jatropha curcas]|uniref:thiosulfate sulfurtransferase 16, chloroplastic isoform X2 n=1 Tax=Jatropha curcas TaxID=180498 RepID=UPI0005FC3470|nr:thiosulfate sulfurtransferase 16, chloroplastic isoform X2 [Jatropha curcas]
MEAKSVVSSAIFTSSSLTPAFRANDINKRKLLLLPLAINPKRWSIGVNQRSFRFRLRGNLEVPTSVPVRVAHELLLAGHRYLDVRTPEEFSAGHVVGAINIPYMYKVGSGMSKNPKFLEQVSQHFGKYDEILVGCQLGKRSMMAATDLVAAGYTGVTDIAGGYAAWTQNKLPTEI